MGAVSTQAADVYVSNSSQLASACSGASSGDVIFIAAGTYTGPFVLSGKSNVTLKSYNGTVYMEGSSSAASNGVIILEVYNSNNISVQNLVFRNNWGNYADGIKIHGYGDGSSVTGCEFYDIGWTTGKTTMPDPSKSAHAIAVVGSTSTSIKNVYIGDNSVHDCITGYSESVTLAGNVEYFLVEGNTLNSNTNIGIDAAGHFSWTGAPASVNYARSGVIRGNTVSNYAGPAGLDAAGGIYTDGGSYNLIENNIVYNYKVGYSIGCEVAGNSANGNILRSNLAYNCSLSGLFLGSNTTSSVNNSEVYNNTFYKCGTGTYDNGQIALQNNSGSVIKNNILYPTNGRLAMVQMGGTSSSSKTQSYNLYWRDNGSTSSLFYNVSGDANAVTQNPLFVNAGGADFRISTTSPAVNAGDPSYSGAGQFDLEGNARVQGSRVDIGAFETNVSGGGSGGGSLSITVDGNTGDWSSVSSISTSGSGGPTGLKVADNSDYLYVLVTGSIDTNYEVFIDSDNSATAGSNEYLYTDWPSTGFDFMVENGTLFAHNGQGSGWSWTSLGAVDLVKSGSVIELAISKSSLGSLSSTVRVAAKMISSAWSASGYIPTTGGSAAPYVVGSAGSRGREYFLEEELSSSIDVYPNPSKSQLNIALSLDEMSEVEVRFYDLGGKQVAPVYSELKGAGSQVVTFRVSEVLMPGLYLTRISVADKQVYNRMVRIEK
ncbi:hypothetical protein BFP72_01635 [Reichenbachiella sp. 5M10]|nr:hypothetical protein BFP72_01635 [Reichenbachiella sp. 5M10]